MAGVSNSSDSDLNDERDHLQEALELTEPIPSVQRQAYILIVGDSGTGKSMLAWSFTRFPRTPAKRYHSIAINGRGSYGQSTSIGLHFFCAPFRSGDDDCFLHQPPESPPYNLVIYLFDVNRRSTYERLFTKWRYEVATYLGRMKPSLLVGNKIDLRPTSREEMSIEQRATSQIVWKEEGERNVIYSVADRYMEVCALAEINTRELLVKILRMLQVIWEPDF